MPFNTKGLQTTHGTTDVLNIYVERRRDPRFHRSQAAVPQFGGPGVTSHVLRRQRSFKWEFLEDRKPGCNNLRLRRCVGGVESGVYQDQLS